MDDYWLHKLRQYRTTSSPSRCDQFVYFDLCLPSQWESQSRTWFAALPVPPGLLPGINSKSSNTQQVPWRPQQQGIQVSSTSSWPCRVPAALTWSHSFPVGWRDANQVLDLSYRWLKSEEAIPNGIGWHSHVLRLERCDFFLGKLAMWLLFRKKKSKNGKQAQNNKIWIHIRYASKTSHTDP